MSDFSNPLTSTSASGGEADASAASARILVVEDDPDLALLTCMSLKKAGYEVAVANDAKQAQVALNISKPDLVVLDVMLPEVDGFELLANLKSQSEMADVPVMMMSAVSEDAYLAQGHRLGAEYYLKKPFMPSQLIAAVKGVFATVRMRQKIESGQK
jgi:DNA-binding response OmpR family regulator